MIRGQYFLSKAKRRDSVNSTIADPLTLTLFLYTTGIASTYIL